METQVFLQKCNEAMMAISDAALSALHDETAMGWLKAKGCYDESATPEEWVMAYIKRLFNAVYETE